MRIDLIKQIDSFKHELEQTKQYAEKEEKSHSAEIQLMTDTHKSQSDILKQSMSKEIDILKQQNVKERTELEQHYQQKVDQIYKEKMETEKVKEASQAELEKLTVSKNMFENMKNIEIKGLKDQLETIKRERTESEAEFTRNLNEKVQQKDKILAELKSENEKSVALLQKSLEEQKSEFEKKQFEMEQVVKQVKLELESVKAESDTICKQKDRQIEKMDIDSKLKLETVENAHKTEVEDFKVKLAQLEEMLNHAQKMSDAEILKLKTEYEATKQKLTEEKNFLIEKYSQEVDELNRNHFDIVRDLHQKYDEDLTKQRNEIHDRDLKIKDLEEHVRIQDENLAEHERNSKCEVEILESRKKREVNSLLEEIATKNKHIDLITTLHQSELKQKSEKFKLETERLKEEIANLELESLNKLGEITQKHIAELNSKDESIAQLKVMMKEVNSEKEREISAWSVKFMMQREEWCANVNELNHQHLIDLKVS